MQTFDDIYILDLHGNSQKKEKCPDGSEDKNVFDIKEGVSIGIFVKKNKSAKNNLYHSELFGSRKSKYQWLSEISVSKTKWEELDPIAPFYLFTKQDTTFLPEYSICWQLNDIFPINGNGVKTRKDKLLIDYTFNNISNRFKDIVMLSATEAIEKYDIKSSDGWDFGTVHAKLDNNVDEKITRLLYRPFDIRYMYFNKVMIERGDHRYPIMQHMINKNINLGLVATRQVTSLNICHFLCTKNLIEMKTCSHDRGTNLFPLYLYPIDAPKATLFDTDIPTDSPGGRKPNLAPKFIEDFAAKLSMQFIRDGKGDRVWTFGPEDIFNYMYAVFHSPTYRKRYAEFLKNDFPRIPLTSNPDLFKELCTTGQELVDLHLMETKAPKITGYPVAGDSTVEKVRYQEPHDDVNGRVWINSTQYFDGVSKEVWEFHIGGYQVCDKWLKDRKGRQLTYDDLTHYQHVVSALAETMKLMNDIDAAIFNHGGWPIG